MKLNGKMAVDPGTLVDDTEIGPQTASEMMKMKPQEVFELVEEELVRKSKEQINAVMSAGNKHLHIDMRQKRRTT